MIILGSNIFDVEVLEIKQINFDFVKKILSEQKSVFLSKVPELN